MQFGSRARGDGLELSDTLSCSLLKSQARLIQNEAAFAIVYERTSKPLFGYLLRVSGSRDVAKDLLQESYCRLLSAKLPEMDEPQLKSYLFRIATNLLRDRWRRGQDIVPEELNPVAREHRDPDAQHDLRTAFGRLKAKERQLLWLAYVEGATHKEIAELVRLRPRSVRLLLFRARRKLAALLGVKSAEADPKASL